MKNILLIGQAASGKGTQAKLLSKRLGLHIIAMGDILRDHKKRNTSIGQMATELDKEGKLMPNEIIIRIMRDEILKHKDTVNGFIFDGVVRTVEQAKTLDDLCDELGFPPLDIIFFNISNDAIIKRALERGKTSGRVEDSDVSIIEKRIKVFDEKTTPVLSYYQDTYDYTDIDAEKSINEVYESIINSLTNYKIPFSHKVRRVWNRITSSKVVRYMKSHINMTVGLVAIFIASIFNQSGDTLNALTVLSLCTMFYLFRNLYNRSTLVAKITFIFILIYASIFLLVESDHIAYILTLFNLAMVGSILELKCKE